MKGLRLRAIDGRFTVCRVTDAKEIDWTDEFLFVGKTDEELSVVTREAHAPRETILREDGWRAFRIDGMLDFSLTGILAGVSRVLAEEQIGIFAVSTYNTDYVLTKEENFARALSALRENGYETV